MKKGERPIKLLRIYGRTHEQKDYKDPFHDIIKSSSVVEGRCLAKFKNDSLHFKIRQRNCKIREMELQLYEQGQNGVLPPLHIQKKLVWSNIHGYAQQKLTQYRFYLWHCWPLTLFLVPMVMKCSTEFAESLQYLIEFTV